MTDVFVPENHTPLIDQPWTESAARSAIETIVLQAVDGFRGEDFWPAHPDDDGVLDGDPSLYFGATGMIWALTYLQSEGAAQFDLDFTSFLSALLERCLASQSDAPYPEHGSLMFGDVALRLYMGMTGHREFRQQVLFERVDSNMELPTVELMWGLPGTMIIAHFMHDLTNEDRWRDAYNRQAARLLEELEDDPNGPIWTQDLYGSRVRLLGAMHGFAGNCQSLLKGWSFLDDDQRCRVRNVVRETLSAHARHSSFGVNWGPVADPDIEASILQHCHGAPGIVSTFAHQSLSSPQIAALLRSSGELIWHAGPLKKGPNLCHGTAGNGYAFLKLFQYTGETDWLDRARAFAMTAISQSQQSKALAGRGRFSLWTGDLGVAIYLWDCIQSKARLPTIDVF